MSAPRGSDLSRSTTVPRSLVHRAAVCEVFLTDSARTSEREVLVAAQLPRVHSYYSDHTATPAHYDPLLLLEAFRQTSILVAHEHLGAPLDSKFSFNSGDLSVTDPEALHIGPVPASATVRTEVVAEKHREGVLTGITIDMHMSLDGRAAASMRMVIQWMPPAAWDGLRARNRAALALEPARAHSTGRRLPPAAVGRHSPQNVVLADAVALGHEVVGQVVVDQSHPALFDHPLDHIPGAVFFEAYRQTALYAAHELLGLSPRCLMPTRVEAVFSRFGEFELPTDCRAVLVDPPGPDRVAFELTALQEENEVATARVVLGRTGPLGGLLTPSAPLVEELS
ncbi:ScbA/BarX family gamma-butyrolactone biosynthesis protein [Streptomyces thermolineatus]|uniref:ScbA/BarX family gamma-butyrolactone biosynthesis protein n=1 Tax=Streptomyces thermolineatus TaxID=44033 RepID=UPI00385133BB